MKKALADYVILLKLLKNIKNAGEKFKTEESLEGLDTSFLQDFFQTHCEASLWP